MGAAGETLLLWTTFSNGAHGTGSRVGAPVTRTECAAPPWRVRVRRYCPDGTAAMAGDPGTVRTRAVNASDSCDPVRQPEPNDASGPSSRVWEARRLQREAWSLIRAGQGDSAIAVSEQLLEHFVRETDDDARAIIGDALAGTASALVLTHPDRAHETLTRLTLLAAGIAIAIAKRSKSAAPGVAQRRRRLQQALRLDGVLIDQFGHALDAASHRTAVEAKINRAGSLFFLGNLVQAFRTISALLDRVDPAYLEIAARPEQPYFEKRVAAILNWATQSNASR
jgi:hypothetical protein